MMGCENAVQRYSLGLWDVGDDAGLGNTVVRSEQIAYFARSACSTVRSIGIWV